MEAALPTLTFKFNSYGTNNCEDYLNMVEKLRRVMELINMLISLDSAPAQFLL